MTPTSLNEIADGSYDVIPDATLSVDVIENSPNGIPQVIGAPDMTFSNYPNPFDNYTIFTYTLPASGNVTLEIHDLLGKVVMIPVNEPQIGGYHRMQMNATTIPMGIYVATLKLVNSNGVQARTLKIIQTK
jgi:hypothetical protein